MGQWTGRVLRVASISVMPDECFEPEPGRLRRVGALREELKRRSREKDLPPPPIEWVKNRLAHLQEVLEQRTARSAQTLRSLLGPIRAGGGSHSSPRWDSFQIPQGGRIASLNATFVQLPAA
jgi:hypothetical protein